MAIETFNRHEKKYRISAKQFDALNAVLRDHMEADWFNTENFTYPICGLYYDTIDDYLIRTSLTHPTYKEKLRLRSYGTPTTGSTIYVEIKKKFRGLTNKRRTGLKLDEAYEFLASGNLPILQPYMNPQVLREVRYLLSQRELRPAVYLYYERRAMFEAGNSNLRISFDRNILSRNYDLRLEAGVYGDRLIPENEWLMEIKTSLAMPLWLTHLLTENEVYPQSFSKYGTAYLRMLSELQNGSVS